MLPAINRFQGDCFEQRKRTILLFALEGAALSFYSALINNNNNLFIMRLGATDYQLSQNVMLSQIVGIALLLPGGIISDRLSNKRKMVVGGLIALAAILFTTGFVPMMGKTRLDMALVLIAISTGPLTLYNMSWQAFFSDVVLPFDRNAALSARTRLAFVFGTIMPLVGGVLLSSVSSVDKKLKVHQIFFFFTVVTILLQVFLLMKIKGGNVEKKPVFRIAEFKEVLYSLTHNKQFLFFAGVTIFFYMTWHLDWTLFFIGQIRYLGFDESWISYHNVATNLVQFLTIGFWSRVNERKGVRFGMFFGAISVAVWPLGFFFVTILPENMARIVFIIVAAIGNFAVATVLMNPVQCLLQVVDERHKAISISVYTVFIALSNAMMPMVGVQIYSSMGGDFKAFLATYIVIIFLRFVAAGLLIVRYKMSGDMPK